MLLCETARRSIVGAAGDGGRGPGGGTLPRVTCPRLGVLAHSCRGEPGTLTMSAHTPRPASLVLQGTWKQNSNREESVCREPD